MAGTRFLQDKDYLQEKPDKMVYLVIEASSHTMTMPARYELLKMTNKQASEVFAIEKQFAEQKREIEEDKEGKYSKAKKNLEDVLKQVAKADIKDTYIQLSIYDSIRSEFLGAMDAEISSRRQEADQKVENIHKKCGEPLRFDGPKKEMAQTDSRLVVTKHQILTPDDLRQLIKNGELVLVDKKHAKSLLKN